MACTTCHVCLLSTVSGRCKDALGKGSASGQHITKLKHYTFLQISMDVYFIRYLWSRQNEIIICWFCLKFSSHERNLPFDAKVSRWNSVIVFFSFRIYKKTVLNNYHCYVMSYYPLSDRFIV